MINSSVLQNDKLFLYTVMFAIKTLLNKNLMPNLRSIIRLVLVYYVTQIYS